jgi:hypothetical protein
MALQGEAKKLYHREYMRRQRAGLPTRGVVKPKVMEQWCSECVLPPSPERIVVSLGSGYRLCQCCYEAAGTLFAAERAMHGRWGKADASLYAFDLLELDGTDLHREPIETRRATLASVLRKSRPGLRLNEHLEHPEGVVVFQTRLPARLRGIVSKRLGSRYRSPDWLKFKNPEAPAVRREAEEDWGR